MQFVPEVREEQRERSSPIHTLARKSHSRISLLAKHKIAKRQTNVREMHAETFSIKMREVEMLHQNGRGMCSE